jgi:hypothetical protein
MSDELGSEREKQLVDQAAQFIVKHDLEDFAEMFLEGTAPYGEIIGNLGFIATYPLAVFFLGQTGSDLANMMGFNYRLNANKILGRVAELKHEKTQKKLQEKENRKGKKKGRFSLFQFARRRSVGSPPENNEA